MEIILLMAGKTILRSGLHVRDGAVIDMATRAFNEGMFTNQIERHFVMVEGFSVRVNTIMAGHAVRPEREDVFRSKCLVHVQVTVGARSLVKRRRVIFYMAILANESGAI